MAPPKRAPGKLGTVARNRNRFRVQVRLNGITGTGPLRTTEADARADLALVRARQTREEIPVFLGRLRGEAAPRNVPPAATSQAFGSVQRHGNRFRVQVVLHGKVERGPLRPREEDADADLALVRARQTRDEIPAVLSRLRTKASRPSGAPCKRPASGARCTRGARRPVVSFDVISYSAAISACEKGRNGWKCGGKRGGTREVGVPRALGTV